MPRIPLFIVGAFTTSGDRPFFGNPAAVCPLEQWLPDELMQQIAAENSLPMTAFFMPQLPGYALRWFLLAGEEKLCGHATLATAHVLVRHLENQRGRISLSQIAPNCPQPGDPRPPQIAHVRRQLELPG